MRLDLTLRMVRTKEKALRKGCRLFSLWQPTGSENAKRESPSFRRRITKPWSGFFSGSCTPVLGLLSLQFSLSILQYNIRKSRDQVMMPFFDDPQTLTYDIIAVQEPWRNSEFFITYHPHRDIFHLIYMGHGSTRVCFYINKRLAISSRNATHHNSDLCTIYLEIHSIGKLHIHNIYNPVSSTNSQPGVTI